MYCRIVYIYIYDLKHRIYDTRPHDSHSHASHTHSHVHMLGGFITAMTIMIIARPPSISHMCDFKSSLVSRCCLPITSFYSVGVTHTYMYVWESLINLLFCFWRTLSDIADNNARSQFGDMTVVEFPRIGAHTRSLSLSLILLVCGGNLLPALCRSSAYTISDWWVPFRLYVGISCIWNQWNLYSFFI